MLACTQNFDLLSDIWMFFNQHIPCILICFPHCSVISENVGRIYRIWSLSSSHTHYILLTYQSFISTGSKSSYNSGNIDFPPPCATHTHRIISMNGSYIHICTSWISSAFTHVIPITHKYLRQTVWNVSLFSWSIWLVPEAPSSIEVSIWKYHCDPDINQLGS